MAELSPSEWLDKLNARFTAATRPQWQDKKCRPREIRPRNEELDTLWSYYVGDAPLPQVAEDYQDVFRDVMRTARCNYAPMCVKAMLDRMELQAVSTLVDGDTNGDDLAAQIMDDSGFVAVAKDLFSYLFAMGESFGMAVEPAGSDNATMHAIDPRRCVGIPDRNNPVLLRAALVRDYDAVEESQSAHLFLPGRKWDVEFDGTKWAVKNENRPEIITGLEKLGGIPVVRFLNEHGLGEYEPHLDLLDRINDMTLKRIIIAAYQAFRQRAIIGDVDDDDDDDDTAEAQPVDWASMAETIFKADPGSLWKVPEGFKFWESSPLELTSILTAKRDDVKEFAAVTSTPLHLITPDAANGSAEGAGLMRESATSKVRDRRARSTPSMKLFWRIAFALSKQPDRGRSMKLHWGPIEFRTLAEKASASSQSAGTLSLEQRCQRIWEMTPEETQENINQLVAEQIVLPNVLTAPAQATASPVTAPATQPGPASVNAA
ncbi:phage portal protein [Mycobacterium marinum]|uniref:phage portal protein n=1 Tax=Mycobacterium marinum TaxID=1781 RepID=UPI0021C3C76D|nr:phage portal protein [Mycobacterium marinum]GJO41954.1 bacteriophage protein [Mycobacterium marinum]